MVSKPYLARFFRKLQCEIGEFLSGQQMISAALLALSALAYQYYSGKLTWIAFKENAATVVYPFIWIVCGFGCYYAIKAAAHLHREMIAEVRAYRPAIAEYRPNPPSPWRGIAASAAAISMLVLTAYWAFARAFPGQNQAESPRQVDREVPPSKEPAPNPLPEAPTTRRSPRVTAPLAVPTVSITGFLGGEGRIDNGFAGIKWQPEFVDVRVNITNGSGIEVQNMDLFVMMDTSIGGIGQATDIPGVSFRMPPQPVQSLRLEGTNAQGNPVTLPMTPSWQMGAIMPSARIYSERLLAHETLELVLASVAMNQTTGTGAALKLPDRLFAPRRDPKTLQVVGTVQTGNVDGAKRFSVMYEKELKR